MNKAINKAHRGFEAIYNKGKDELKMKSCPKQPKKEMNSIVNKLCAHLSIEYLS